MMFYSDSGACMPLKQALHLVKGVKDPYAAKRREFGARGEIFGKIRQKSNILADFREPRYASLFTNRFTSRPRVTRYVNLRSKVYSSRGRSDRGIG